MPTPSTRPHESTAAARQRQHDADGRAQHRDDVQQTGKHAQRRRVTDVQRDVDHGARQAQNEHQAALADEPAAHANLHPAQRIVEAAPVACRKQRQGPVIRDIALQREVDGEDEAHGDGEQRVGPGLDGKQQVSRRSGRRSSESVR